MKFTNSILTVGFLGVVTASMAALWQVIKQNKQPREK